MTEIVRCINVIHNKVKILYKFKNIIYKYFTAMLEKDNIMY